MKNLTQYIQEKLHIGKYKKEDKYHYHPKDIKELKNLIEDRIKKEGNNCNLNDIDVSNVTDMSDMFNTSEFNGDISEWDVSNVINMEHMFYNSDFNGDISKWNVSNVEDMSCMFEHSKFNGDISKWDVSNVKDMSWMFKDSKFNRDISKWDISNVKDMSWMFAFSKFNQINVTKWNLIHLTKNEQIEKMFYKSTLWNRHFEKIPQYMNIY